MLKTNKMPAILFYTGDWLKDPAVRCMSLSARGLWIDMLCLMYESPKRGYLSLANGEPVSAIQLARMVGGATKEINALLSEMRACGVYSVNEHDVIYSRRMVSDEIMRGNKSKAGKASAEARNRSSTEAQQKSNRQGNTSSTAIENENEIESSSNKYLLSRRAREKTQPEVECVLNAIPKNRMNNPTKTKEAVISALDRAVGLEGDRLTAGRLLAERITLYYQSDEGSGEYAKRPHNWLSEDCHLADPSSWKKQNNEKTGWDSIPKGTSDA